MTAPLERAHRVGAEVAAVFADEVDREARFPGEALAALKQERLLGILVPEELGGEGLAISAACEVCHALGQYCASTAMVYAMHQIQVWCLVRHALGSPWHRAFLQRCADEQLLIASATSEAGIGGEIRRSACAIEARGSHFALEKDASVISYGPQADAILVTARRTPDSPPSDQVIALVLRGDYRLEQTSVWDALGMRGTCSNGYRVLATGEAAQLLPVPFADVSAWTMLPAAHLTWGSLWLGIASDAVARARAFCRAEARRKPDAAPAGAARLAEAVGMLQQMRAQVGVAVRSYEAAIQGGGRAPGLSFAVEMNALKTTASLAAVQVVSQAMLVCGISGYRNGTRFSLGRHLRDVHSAAVMVSNDRILAHTAQLVLVQAEERGLFA